MTNVTRRSKKHDCGSPCIGTNDPLLLWYFYESGVEVPGVIITFVFYGNTRWKQRDVLTLTQKATNLRNAVRDGLSINDFQKKARSKFRETVVLIKDTYRDAFLMGSENFPSTFYRIQSMLFRP